MPIPTNIKAEPLKCNHYCCILWRFLSDKALPSYNLPDWKLSFVFGSFQIFTNWILGWSWKLDRWHYAWGCCVFSGCHHLYLSTTQMWWQQSELEMQKQREERANSCDQPNKTTWLDSVEQVGTSALIFVLQARRQFCSANVYIDHPDVSFLFYFSSNYAKLMSITLRTTDACGAPEASPLTSQTQKIISPHACLKERGASSSRLLP